MDGQIEAPQETREAMIEKALARYEIADAAIADLRGKYAGLKVSGLEDRKGLAAVHEARMVVRGHRVAVEKKRVELKADALEFGRRVDGEAKRLTKLLEEVEAPLEAQENAIVEAKAKIAREAQERAEAARKAKLDDRMRQVVALGGRYVPSVVEGLSDAQFAETLVSLRTLQEREAAEARERELQAAAKREADRIAAERLAADQKALEAAQAVQREAEARLARDREAVEAAQRKVAEEAAAAERARELEAAKAKAAADALERKAAAEKAEAEAKARRAAAMPEFQRVLEFAAALSALPIPETRLRDRIADAVGEACEAINDLAQELQR